MKDGYTNVDGKFYKEHNVVMLATDKGSNLHRNNLSTLYTTPNISTSVVSEDFHLYILSDEDTKAGEYFYNFNDNKVWKTDTGMEYSDKHRKIIATTNSELKVEYPSHNVVQALVSLPRPSNDFIKAYIKAYNENNPITKVLVEYELKQITKKEDYQYQNGESNLNYQLTLKVAPDNTITIKPVKEDYSEIVAICKSYLEDGVAMIDIIEFLKTFKP
jgi:hypothetical protein